MTPDRTVSHGSPTRRHVVWRSLYFSYSGGLYLRVTAVAPSAGRTHFVWRNCSGREILHLAPGAMHGVRLALVAAVLVHWILFGCNCMKVQGLFPYFQFGSGRGAPCFFETYRTHSFALDSSLGFHLAWVVFGLSRLSQAYASVSFRLPRACGFLKFGVPRFPRGISRSGHK